jgi:hypothetical protein
MAVQLRRSTRWIASCLLVAAGALGVGAGGALATTNYYVSPTGSDAAAGTIGAPFRTLARAQTAVRAVTSGMRADVIVNVRAGTYTLTSTLALDNSRGDSGMNGYKVIWQGYGYGTRSVERPVVSGGQTVSGWSLWNAGTNVWRTDLGSLSTRQLYRNGVRVEQGDLAAIPGTVTRTRTGYTTTSTTPQTWSNKDSIEFLYTNEDTYSAGRCGVASITGTRSSSTITMDQPCFEWATAHYTYNEEEPPKEMWDPTLANSVSFLSAGEWAIDRNDPAHHYLYYRAASGTDPRNATFVVPKLQTLVRGLGTARAPLHDVQFKGLTFEHGTWLEPDQPEGFVHIYGDFIYYGGSPSGSLEEPETVIHLVPGNLDFNYTQSLLFEGNRFQKMGADAIDLRGTRSNTFRGNVFTDVAGGALKLDGLDDGSDTANTVVDNYVHGVGKDYLGSIAVYWEDVINSTFSHNQINDVPYSGIAATTPDATGPYGLDIKNNLIYDTVNSIMDGGGIYTSGAQGTSYANGAEIEDNVVYGTLNPFMELTDPTGAIGAPNAIYNDDGGDYVRVKHNVLYRNHQSWGGVYPLHLKGEYNYWDDATHVFYTDGNERIVQTGNTLLNARDPAGDCASIPACDAIVDAAGIEAAWQYILTW